MKKQLKNNGFNRQITKFLMVGLLTFLLIGCDQVKELSQSNTNSSDNTSVENTNTPSEDSHISVENSNISVEDSNTTVENSNTSTEEVNSAIEEKPPEVKAFENNLIGTWSNKDEKAVFGNDEIKFYNTGSDQPSLTWKYSVVDEKTVEITDQNGNKSSATMSLEDNNTKLVWKDKMGSFEYKRESSKP